MIDQNSLTSTAIGATAFSTEHESRATHLHDFAQVLGHSAAKAWLAGSLTAAGAMSAALPKSDQ